MMKASDDSIAVAYDGALEGGDGQTGRFARRARYRRHRTGGGTRQYGAFGRTIRQTGEFAEANPFRYSTKYTDDGTSLIYYGKRYYHSAWGRFITRDPAQESGGLNLYGFTGNNGVNRIDYLGLSAIEDGHTMDPYGTECTREEVDMGDRVMVTTDCNDGSAPFTEFFDKVNPGVDTFGGDGGITIDTGGLPGIVVTPNTGGNSTVVVQDENPGIPERWTEAECSELASQIDTIKHDTGQIFDHMAGLNTRYENAIVVAGTGAIVGVATDTAVIWLGGSALAGSATRSYMQSQLGRSLTHGVGEKAAYQVATSVHGRAAFWSVSVGVVGSRSGEMLTDGINPIVAKGPSITTLGGSLQNRANSLASTMISNADKLSQGMTQALADLRAQLRPRLADFSKYCE